MLFNIDAVSKTYERRGGAITALEPVDFDIHEHEFVSIVDPSGCCESTLLMNGLRWTTGT